LSWFVPFTPNLSSLQPRLLFDGFNSVPRCIRQKRRASCVDFVPICHKFMQRFAAARTARCVLEKISSTMKNIIRALKVFLCFVWAGAFGLGLATPPSALWLVVLLPLIGIWIAALRTTPETDSASHSAHATVEKNPRSGTPHHLEKIPVLALSKITTDRLRSTQVEAQSKE